MKSVLIIFFKSYVCYVKDLTKHRYYEVLGRMVHYERNFTLRDKPRVHVSTIQREQTKKHTCVNHSGTKTR